MQYSISPMCTSDIAPLMALERSIFSDPQETSEFSALPSLSYARVLCAKTPDGCPIGYAVAYCIADECELLRVAVAPAFRGQGIAKALLQRLFSEAQAQGAQHFFLEVRASNTAARALYAMFGFTVYREKPSYYNNPPETAVFLRAQAPLFRTDSERTC